MNYFLNTLLLLIVSSSFYAQDLPQTQRDSYTRYELLEPATHSFRIIYDVTATTEGKEVYFNTLRKGSKHKVTQVLDRMTGKPLKWDIVNGVEAMKSGHPRAQKDGEYLKVYLNRPIPKAGGIRIRIDKTYKDPESYYTEGDHIVFVRRLGINRNSLVLPEGYEISSCNYPSQVELG
ncbi:MAG: hypothetical protein HKN68_17065, partial [Saprospiraceae bacterium]|nr:hypothetical protein [Saprospiraceae bacterium]